MSIITVLSTKLLGTYERTKPNRPASGSGRQHQRMVGWLVTSLIMMIPLVNLIMMFVWAFSSNTNPNKANYFKAALILFAIVMAIYLVLAVVFWGSIAANQYQ